MGDKSNKNTFESILKIQIDVNRFQPGCNTVLFEFDPHSNDKTKGGIYVPMDGRNYAQNAIRVSKIIKNPLYLHYDKKRVFDMSDDTSMLWKTEIETMPGDIAVTNHLDSNSAWLYECEGKLYRTMNYASIDAVKRSERIIPVNGNILIKPIQFEEKFLEYGLKKDERNLFEICHVGTRNKEYGIPETKDRLSPMDIRRATFRRDSEYEFRTGQKIIIINKFLKHLYDLEHPIHAKFDNGNLYKVCKRYMIGGVFE